MIVSISIITIQFITIALLFLKYRKRKSDWNSKLFNANERDYIINYFNKLQLPEEALSFLNYCFESTLFFEKNNELTQYTFKIFHESNQFKTPFALILKKYNHILKIDDVNDNVNIKGVIEQLHRKSKELVLKIEKYPKIDAEEENKILMESFALFFIFFDLIENLQNKNWATKDSVNGLKCFLNEKFDYKEYNGNENILEYSKTLLNVYQIFDNNNSIPLNQIILGYKLIK